MTRSGRTSFAAAPLARGRRSGRITLSSGCRLPLTDAPPWISCGGPPGHPHRSLPRALRVPTPTGLQRVHIAGVFALHGEDDVPGTVGATLSLLTGDEIALHIELVAGRHYHASTEPQPPRAAEGDGCAIHTLGEVEIDGTAHRLDVLSVDVPPDLEAGELILRSQGACAAFWIQDVFLEHIRTHGCPFHEDGGGIPLSELPSIVRLRDRPRLLDAISLLESALHQMTDLEEAKGQALTFVALVLGALLEVGGGRELHRVQLSAARDLDTLTDLPAVIAKTREILGTIAEPILKEPEGPSTHLVDRALQIVERNYARDLTDDIVAHQLGLSTSHFRYLFKSTVGSPFHRHLINVRLEKAHAMLVEGGRSVSEVAHAVGFAGLSHFSRAFSARFGVPPTGVRRLIPAS